jgi:hypothetical protein
MPTRRKFAQNKLSIQSFDRIKLQEDSTQKTRQEKKRWKKILCERFVFKPFQTF